MTDDPETTPSAEEAFALLGNDTRIRILRALGAAEGPLSFSTLYERVDVQGSGQFNYHLEQLVDHFVRKTEEGYVLTRAGRRVVEAVLAGTVTEDPTVERTPVDEACAYCGAPIEVTWAAGSVILYCTECAGKYGEEHATDKRGAPAGEGYLGRYSLPPAGVEGRTPEEMLRAAWTWGRLEMMAVASGICPRCSGSVEQSVRVCTDHDADGGRCSTCHNRDAISVSFECTTCIFEGGGSAAIGLVAQTELLDLLTDHGLNPVTPAQIHALDRVHNDYGERIHATDPFEGEFTFSVDEDSLLLRVNANLDVIEAVRNP
ncbi:MAG: helix-turn-helix domain-containing protein [Halapricum sp.]